MSAINLLKLLIRDEGFLEFVLCFSSDLFLSNLHKFLSISHKTDYQDICNKNPRMEYFSQFNEIQIMRECLLILTVVYTMVNEPRLMYEINKKERKRQIPSWNTLNTLAE
jgi:hypothetical protein